jgi:hypothetical protein
MFGVRAGLAFGGSCPPITGTVPLDEALNQIGTVLYPKQWGRAPRFSELPLLRNPRGQIFREKRVKGRYGARKVRVLTLSDSPELDYVVTMYGKVIEELQNAIKDKRVRAVVPRGDRLFGVGLVAFEHQRSSVFGRGVVNLGFGIRKVRLDLTSFQEWLEPKRVRERLPPEFCVSVIEALKVAHARDRNRTWSKPRLIAILQKAVFPVRVVAENVENEIWSRLDQSIRSRGRSPKTANKWDEELLSEIRNIPRATAQRGSNG